MILGDFRVFFVFFTISLSFSRAGQRSTAGLTSLQCHLLAVLRGPSTSVLGCRGSSCPGPSPGDAVHGEGTTKYGLRGEGRYGSIYCQFIWLNSWLYKFMVKLVIFHINDQRVFFFNGYDPETSRHDRHDGLPSLSSSHLPRYFLCSNMFELQTTCLYQEYMGIMMIIRMYQVVGELTIIKEAMSKSRAVQKKSFCETRSTCVKMKLDRTLRQRLSWRSV